MEEMSKYPWVGQYDDGLPTTIDLEYSSGLEMFRSAVSRLPDNPLIRYFDTTLTLKEVDRLSDVFAAALAERGLRPGDRFAVYLQNIPQYLIAMLAIWKAGAIMVNINPMYRVREVAHIINDSAALGILCLESLYSEVVVDVLKECSLSIVITTSELDFVSEPDRFELLKASKHKEITSSVDFMDLLRVKTVRPLLEIMGEENLSNMRLSPEKVAFLTYTSGTTGPAKGAMNTHENVVFTAQAYRDWIQLTDNDCILGIAPLFHITGLIGHMALALLVPIPLVLSFRFEQKTIVNMIERWHPTFTIGAITAYTSLMNTAGVGREQLRTLKKVYTGGQPVPASIVDNFEERFGLYIRQAYGLTETTSPTHFVPLGKRAPADPETGCLSAGVPIFNTLAKVVDDNGEEVGIGTNGEIAVSGPQVVPGYWNNDTETAKAFANGWFLTGDIGFMNREGWFFVVDRKKDQINASGYKVWPREVEDVLCEHVAVREAAVIGVPDSYRGETVKAFVSFKLGKSATIAELKQHCRDRLAVYKSPSDIVVLEELPKTASGKILRRVLRDAENKNDK